VLVHRDLITSGDLRNVDELIGVRKLGLPNCNVCIVSGLVFPTKDNCVGVVYYVLSFVQCVYRMYDNIVVKFHKCSK